MRQLKSLGNVILGCTAMSLVMSAALAADGRAGREVDVMPLPPRPEVLEPAAKSAAIKAPSKEVPSKPAERWTIERQQPQPKIVLSRVGAQLNRSQKGNAVAGPKNAPWPVIILAAGEPIIGNGARKVEFDKGAFKPDPDYADKPYDPKEQVNIYGGKSAVDTQRPILEFGTPLYDVGPLGQGTNLLGQKNLVFGHLYAFGDWRTAVAYNDNGNGDEVGQIATRLNLDVDLGLTATERLHALFQPLQDDAEFTRCEFAGEGSIDDCELEYDFEPQTAFFEGDIGAITAGLTGSYNDIDMPITAGLIPLIFQNGVWLEDAFIGGAASLPSINSKTLDISNADITVFGGFDQVNANGVTDANGNIANSNVNIYGIASFIETLEGYIETGYAYVDAEDSLSDQDYHSATIALTRRYGGKISNSLRLVGSFGQDRDQGEDQNGLMILAENSLITSKPYQFVPYGNFFVGFDRPVPLARQNGILKNTGIAFESDALTGFPFLNDTGQNAYGGAVGVQHLFDLDQQIVVELAAVRNLEDISDSFEEVVGNQYAISARYQLPLSNAWIFRADAIHGLRESQDDITGIRTELRFKF